MQRNEGVYARPPRRVGRLHFYIFVTTLIKPEFMATTLIGKVSSSPLLRS